MIGGTLRSTVLVTGASLLLGFAASWLHPELRGGPSPPLAENETTVAKALLWGHEVLWIDTRSDDSFARDHIPGALSFNPSAWDQNLNQLLARWSSGLKIVVYCDAPRCDLSKQIASRLRDEAGLPDVYYLRGGWESWQKQR